MYEEITRESLSAMQTVANRSSNNVSSQTRTMAFLAVLLFAVAGLISGFAVGAFIHPKPRTGSGTASGSTHPVVQKTKESTPVTSSHPTFLADPILTLNSYFQKADGSSTYTISVQAVDQSIDKHHGKPIHASDITCKLWLTKDGNVSANMPSDRLRSVSTLQTPFPKEIEGVLSFSPNTSQVQSSNNNGRATWDYTISSSLDPGTYYLVVLLDWNGIHYNWSWKAIIVKHAD